MNKLTVLIGISLGLLMVGCASAYAPTKLTKNLKGENVVCFNGCSLEWDRANFWVNKHSKMKLQSSSSTLIETYNPYRSGQMGFSISKEPLGGSKYKINVEVSKYGSMVELVTGMVTSNDVKRIINHYIKTGIDKSSILGGNAFTSPIR